MNPFVIKLPEPSLVALIGTSGAGKTTFAARHFLPTEVVSSDRCRGMVCDDEVEQGVNDQAFAVVHAIARARLALRKLVVIDATNVQPEARAPLLELAREADLFAVGDRPRRPDPDLRGPQRPPPRPPVRPPRRPGPGPVAPPVAPRPEGRGVQAGLGPRPRRHRRRRRSAGSRSGPTAEPRPARSTSSATSTAASTNFGSFSADSATSTATRRSCPSTPTGDASSSSATSSTAGPTRSGVLDLVRRLVGAARAFCVAGNHDEKLLKHLRGKGVQLAHGLAATVAQVEALPPRSGAGSRPSRDRSSTGWFRITSSTAGKLVVAHAGMKAEYQGRSSGRVRVLRPLRRDHRRGRRLRPPRPAPLGPDYRGKALVVFGHTPVRRARAAQQHDQHRHRLLLRRLPDRAPLSRRRDRLRPRPPDLRRAGRPFLDLDPPRARPNPPPPPTRAAGDGLRIEDVAGKRLVPTRLMGSLSIRAEQSAPALEVLSRFAADPRWLIYLPPTMAPCPASPSGPYLEHPGAAFAQYRRDGVARVSARRSTWGRGPSSSSSASPRSPSPGSASTPRARGHPDPDRPPLLR